MKKKGSFTIEAAMIVPFIFMIVLLLIHLSFFLYNRHTATVIASRAALKGVQMEQEGKAQIKQELSFFLKEETESRFIFATSAHAEVTVTMTKVKVTVEFIQNMPFKKLHCKVGEEMSRLHPVAVLWEKERFQKAE